MRDNVIKNSKLKRLKSLILLNLFIFDTLVNLAANSAVNNTYNGIYM
jgi:hypothetical protein